MLSKHMEKKLDSNYTKMLQAILNTSWRQHPTKQQLYSHLPPITKTIRVRWTRHVEHCWRSRDEHISNVLLWTPSHGRAKAGQPARTYLQQLCADTGCSPEDLPGAMEDRDGWQERISEIRAGSMTWRWVCPHVGFHKRMSLMSLPLLLEQCSTCLVCFTWMVCEMEGKWPYNQHFEFKNIKIGIDFIDLSTKGSNSKMWKENVLFLMLACDKWHLWL